MVSMEILVLVHALAAGHVCVREVLRVVCSMLAAAGWIRALKRSSVTVNLATAVKLWRIQT